MTLLARPSGSEDDGEEPTPWDVCLGRGDKSPMGQARGARGREETHRLLHKRWPQVGCLRPRQADQEAFHLPPMLIPQPSPLGRPARPFHISSRT